MTWGFFRIIFLLENPWNRYTVYGPDPRCNGPRSSQISLNIVPPSADLRLRSEGRSGKFTFWSCPSNIAPTIEAQRGGCGGALAAAHQSWVGVALQRVDLDGEGHYSKRATRGTLLDRCGALESDGLGIVAAGGSSFQRRLVVPILRDPPTAVRAKWAPQPPAMLLDRSIGHRRQWPVAVMMRGGTRVWATKF
jgi:hypothetical protein